MKPILPTTTDPRELRAPVGAYRIAEATPAVAQLEEALGGVLVSFAPYGETWAILDSEELPRFCIYMDGAKLIGPDGKTRAGTTIPGYGSGVDGRVRESLCQWALGVLEALKEEGGTDDGDRV